MNFIAILVAALIPTITGFIWYNPKVFGTAWQKASGVTDEQMKGANMGIIFGVSLVLSILLASMMYPITIHQSGLNSLFVGDESAEGQAQLAALMEQLGGKYRTFKHGAFHGALAGLFFALPILGTNALFERKGFKYIAINVGYWTLTLALMGGLVCGWV
ncbi:MAG: DUF1761 domain-containing protein [Saprospiraceae bacterium]|nr:DUF1761 domain-containing protein [Saprospiraceae bacterium]